MPSGKNICNCPNPPGGQAVCSEDQLAICRVENGIAYTECIDQPEEVRVGDDQALNNWVLSHVLGQTRRPTDRISPTEAQILRGGVFTIPGTKNSVSFRVPLVKPRGAPAMRA
jgi:hypothetical protein